MTSDKNQMQAQRATSYLSCGSGYLEALYESYIENPESVTAEWQHYFESVKREAVNGEVNHAEIRDYFIKLARQRGGVQINPLPSSEQGQLALKQAHAMQLINAFRSHGHHFANLDPLGMAERERREVLDLTLDYHHFTKNDLDLSFKTESPLSSNGIHLRDLYAALKETYCGSIGVEFMHISDPEETQWVQQHMESVRGKFKFLPDEKCSFLERLSAADGLEKYLGRKYVGQKRFSLEGADSLVPMLHTMIQRAGSQGVKEMVLGMAHRGRLNVLINILGKATEDLFLEFEGNYRDDGHSGDVKYHLGFSSNIETPGGLLHMALAFNPSHLEIIGPVVEGSVRARQRRRDDTERQEVVPIIIHGDAAIAGQGVVMETLNISQARGYTTGGTIHIVINNQVGFTTSNPLDARSTLYCTDIAKMVQAPVFHVNGDDVEAVVFATQMALDFRMKFKKDVLLDLVCYRRHGHNEADEPSMTQPMMYKKIKSLPVLRKIYAEQLITGGTIDQAKADQFKKEYQDALDEGKVVAQGVINTDDNDFTVDWKKFIGQDWNVAVNTAVPLTKLQDLAERLTTLPKGFEPNPQVNRELENRNKMAKGELPINWGFAETMAYASLLTENYTIRISGQDSSRGTFAHRHAVLHDRNTGEVYTPLAQIDSNNKDFIIIDSILSEEAVVSFEYGFATANPNALVIWEAQFGDFANGSQVVIDQFISSGEQKWGRLSHLVMFLPHGHEGQGPEHTSARLERFLQLCAEHNMQVCVPTTPAQAFHMIRRHMIRHYRKPLIVMTPKSLLRHKSAVCDLKDLTNGKFYNVIPEVDSLKASHVKRIILCSGKVYYDLIAKRQNDHIEDVAILRIEQLYPFPSDDLKTELSKYKKVKEIVWCQEESKNQGAWYCTQHHFKACLGKGQVLHYAGRPASASPAAGAARIHVIEQNALVQQAFEPFTNER